MAPQDNPVLVTGRQLIFFNSYFHYIIYNQFCIPIIYNNPITFFLSNIDYSVTIKAQNLFNILLHIITKPLHEWSENGLFFYILSVFQFSVSISFYLNFFINLILSNFLYKSHSILISLYITFYLNFLINLILSHFLYKSHSISISL